MRFWTLKYYNSSQGNSFQVITNISKFQFDLEEKARATLCISTEIPIYLFPFLF